jgi:hypothetical protein
MSSAQKVEEIDNGEKEANLVKKAEQFYDEFQKMAEESGLMKIKVNLINEGEIEKDFKNFESSNIVGKNYTNIGVLCKKHGIHLRCNY